jgi:hypothetical protein
VAERSSAGIAHALGDGFSRVLSAPVAAIGMFVVLRVLDLSSDDNWTIAAGAGVRRTLLPLLFWAFAYGGLLDRYARNRPTRGHGFFAACGAHVMPLARLAILPLLVVYALLALEPPFLAGAAITLAVDVVMQFARIRLVVEDRRSATGSILAGVRFIGRNVVSVAVLWLVYGLLHVAVSYAYQTVAPSLRADGWTGRVINEAFFALSLWQSTLFPYAASLALFQSRLAHAGYTAAPALEWPESASAEAIANASPRMPS